MPAEISCLNILVNHILFVPVWSTVPHIETHNFIMYWFLGYMLVSLLCDAETSDSGWSVIVLSTEGGMHRQLVYLCQFAGPLPS